MLSRVVYDSQTVESRRKGRIRGCEKIEVEEYPKSPSTATELTRETEDGRVTWQLLHRDADERRSLLRGLLLQLHCTFDDDEKCETNPTAGTLLPWS